MIILYVNKTKHIVVIVEIVVLLTLLRSLVQDQRISNVPVKARTHTPILGGLALQSAL